MNRVISIQLEYIFDDYWAVAVHRSSTTSIYHKITASTWERIHNLPCKSQSGTLSGDRFKFNFE